MIQIPTSLQLATAQLVVVLRAKRILHEAAEVAAGRLVAVRYTAVDGGESYSLYPARVACYARQLLGTLPSEGVAVAFSTQGRTEAGHYAPEGVPAALLALNAHQLAARRHTLRRIARNSAKIVRLRAQEGRAAA
jgi:hypothetical protein